MTDSTQHRVMKYLEYLCRDLAGREVGSSGNRAATEFFAAKIGQYGFDVFRSGFDCMAWEDRGTSLRTQGEEFALHTGPYSLGYKGQAELAVAGTLEELRRGSCDGKILLLLGNLAAGQLMPKNFPFYNPEDHRELVALLERKQPQAIVAATGRDPSLAGGVSPFPLIEDGDFDIPNAYMDAATGARVASSAGQEIMLEIRSGRLPAQGWNVSARAGPPGGARIVCCAHIDAKRGTPGAIDNASGIACLLLLAELLEPVAALPPIEIVAINGEDYYAASGETLYLAENKDDLPEIRIGINIDGVGYRDGRTAFSFYDVPDALETAARHVFSRYASLVEGPAWYQSDHSIFLLNGRPAMAFTSEKFAEIWSEIAHTEKDDIDIIDPLKVVEAAYALRDFILLAGST